MQMISKFMYRIFYIVFGFIFSWFYLYGIGKAKENEILVFLMEAVLIMVGYLLYRMIQRLPDMVLFNIKRWTFVFIALFFITQVIFTMVFRTENTFGWDFDTVVYLAKCYVKNIDVSYTYLASYSTNIVYFWFVVLIFYISKLLFGECYVELLLLTNIIFLNISLLYVYKIVKLIKGFRAAIFTIIVCVLFTPFWFYLPIAYQDIFSMPLMILPIYLFTKYNVTKKLSVATFLAIGVIGAIGFFFKGNTTIAFIAIVIFLVLSDNRLMCKTKSIIFMFIGFVLMYLVIQLLISKMGIITKDEVYDNKIPLTHLIYMSFVDDGSWNANVVAETTQIKGYNEKIAFTKRKIKEKFDEYGVDGLFWQISRKESIVILNHGTLNADMYVVRDPKHERLVKWVLADDSWINNIYRYYSQSFWRALLLLTILQIWASIKNIDSNDSKHLPNIILFGTILLFMFWESNSRYLVNTASVIIIMATMTYNSLYEIAKSRRLDDSI